MTASWSIRRFDGLEGLQALEGDWNRLVAAMPDRGFHHAHETHVAWALHAESHRPPFMILALHDGEQIRAICPLQRGSTRLFRGDIPAWTLPFGFGNVVRDLICPPDEEAERELVPRILEYLRASKSGMHWLVFDRVLERSSCWRALAAVSTRSYCTDVVATVDEIDCDRSFGQLTAELPRKFRSNLRNARTKLAALDGSAFKRITEPNELLPAFETFLAIEASGWKAAEAAGNAMRKKPHLLAFYRQLVATLRSGAQCEFNELHGDGRVLASLLCVRAGAEYAIIKTTYDESYARVSPGALLLDWTLEWCCADPAIRRVNLVSHQDWLRRWHPAVLPNYDVYLTLRTVTGHAWVRLLRLRFRHGKRLKVLLQRARNMLRFRHAAPGQAS